MSDVMLRVTDFSREPEFHLDELLGVLSLVPDGFRSARKEVVSNHSLDSALEPRWELDTGWYEIEVDPDYRCGWSELGDGKVLTALLKRLNESEGRCNLRSVWGTVMNLDGERRRRMRWEAKVKLGSKVHYQGAEECSSERLGCKGMGQNDNPGVAVLLAYLRAWGVLE